MYLLELDDNGLVKEDLEHDGWKSIPSFLDLYKSLGIKAITVVALYADHLSPLRYYPEKDRFNKALDFVCNERKIKFLNDKIQLAIINYKELQYSHTIEEKRLLESLKINALNEIKSIEDPSEKIKALKRLSDINSSLEAFEKKNGQKDLYLESPVRNGYKLSRLEIKLTDKKSFYYDKEKLKKPEQTV